MTTTPLAGILFTLVATLAVGALLRRTDRLPRGAAHVLNRVILDVTLPALVVGILAQAELDRAIVGAIIAVLGAQLVAYVGSISVTRALGLPRATQGAASLTGSYGNTAFLGVPLAAAVFGRLGASTAVMVDSVNTTVLMWTVGIAVARMLGGGGADTRTIRQALVTPLTLAVVLGLVLNLARVPVPSLVLGALERVGAATTARVFLSLGLTLDVSALRGRMLAIGGVTAVKLVVSPLIAYALVRAMHLHGAIAQVAVTQAAMPSAMVSVILAAETGCDGAFASGAAVATTLGAIVTLPIVAGFVGGF